jgi:hypothetical protein
MPIPTGNTAVDSWTDGGFRLGNLVALVGDLASPIATQWLCAGRPESHLIDVDCWADDMTVRDANKAKCYARDKGRVALFLAEDARHEEGAIPSLLDVPASLEMADLAFVVRDGQIHCVKNRNGATGSAPFSMED